MSDDVDRFDGWTTDYAPENFDDNYRTPTERQTQTMTRKDYVAIASAFAHVRHNSVEAATAAGNAMFWMLTAHVADVLAADNPAFDRARFVTAVRGES